MAAPLLQRALTVAFAFATSIYYRRERFGEEVPATGPVLLVANHPNGLVDPVLMMSTTTRPLRFLGKAPLFELPVLGALLRGFRALPVHRRQDGAASSDNEQVFESVFAALADRDAVCLFPEGVSHDAPELKELRTGAARMALGAEARAGFRLGVTIVPVGLVYRAKRRLRSRVAACVGKPITIADLEEAYAADERGTVRKLTERISEHLRDVTLRLERWEDLPLIEFAAQTLRPRDGERLMVVHEFAASVARLRARSPETVDRIADRVIALRERLRELGIGPDNLHADYRAGAVARFAARMLASLLLVVPLALLGALYWFVPYLVLDVAPRLTRPTRDTYATYQILAGVIVVPVWWCATSWLAFQYVGVAGPPLVVALGTLFGLVALWFVDWREEILGDVLAFLRLRKEGALRAQLVEERDAIAAEIASLADETEPAA